ncbi:MAG: hypothetical protein DRQ44_01700 [Gammaproteobacteria bacterium]|nr:MAG: hypothetical protein DRQ44_01700 [Gammaproteobacteria bacterium]
MQIKYNFYKNRGSVSASTLSVLLSLFLVACADVNGPAIEARSQSISFSAVPILNLDDTATATATANSDLVVNYRSMTTDVCTVNSNNGLGLVEALTPGTCIIAANQSGNTTFAPAPQVTQNIPVIFEPNQTITFDSAPTLGLFSTAIVSATASSGLAVSYGSDTLAICTVNSSSGLVEALTLGDCLIIADQAGDDNYIVAPPVALTITVSAPPGMTVPGAPTGVTATLGVASNEVIVSFGATDSGGSPITGYTVSSISSGITGTGTGTPITVTCNPTCTGYAFSVIATNDVGDSAPSASADVLTTYNVVETFYEPLTQPRDSIFIGTFTFNSTTQTVSNLQGIVSESMTGDLIAYPDDTMSWLPLNHQLSSVYDPVLGGLLVTTFLNSDTNTLAIINPDDDGWSPGTGYALHYGFDFSLSALENAAVNPGNAYAMIFVNTEDPTAPLTQGQIDKLAYADCAPDGMMGSLCMTGTTVAGYGVAGSMDGYPVSQVITRQP